MPEPPEPKLSHGALESDRSLAEHFGLELATTPTVDAWRLVRTPAGMSLRAPANEGDYALVLSATEGPMARRLRTARRTDPLPRAVGMHRRRVTRIVDATAGLGRDAMVLAHLGSAVTALERVPALCFLLQTAARDACLPVEVVRADAVTWLRACADRALAPEVVYLDPMFADVGKAQVKKEMQACRALAGPPRDLTALLAAARRAARDRVVVKRHAHHPPIGAGVSFEVKGERVRFDVYLTP
jgi:16S rRNA (guanine1516-N2)-methyltransferase